MGVLVFGGHDPGSINHTRPIANFAKSKGRSVEILRLRPEDGSVWGGREQAADQLDALAAAGGGIDLLVCGISTNRAELEVVSLCHERGIPCGMVIDFAPGHRLQGVEGLPSLVLVTNRLAQKELVSKYGMPEEKVVIGGSAYLEELSTDRTPPKMTAAEIHDSYGVGQDCILLPFFLSPDDMVPNADTALEACLRALIADVQEGVPEGDEVLVVVRCHPRNDPKTVARMGEVCAEDWGAVKVVLDLQAEADNKSLAKATRRTLSMGSTVSVECHAWGAPSAYYQRGWDPTRIEAIMACLPVERLTTREHVKEFLFGGGGGGAGGGGGSFNVENCTGAAERSWDALSKLLK